MSQPAATSNDFAAGVVVIDVATAAAAGSAPGAAPAWIKIGPRGAFTCRDGRSFSFSPEALVARFAADGVDVPVDLDHDIVANRPGAKTQGWIKQLEARADGLYGRVEWLESGEATLKARTHRYVSPSFHHDAANAATWVHSVSLVPAPALPGAAVASAQPAPKQEPARPMKAIAEALGLTPDASEAACLSALTTLKGGVVAKDVHDATLASLSAAKNELDAIKAAARKADVDALLEGALKARKIVPAEKGAYAKLCATDAGLEQVRALIEAKPAQLSASGLDDRPAPAGGLAAGEPNAVALAAKAMAHQADLAAKGVVIDIAEAVNAVSAQEARA